MRELSSGWGYREVKQHHRELAKARVITIGHAERSAASAVFGFDNLITAELDTLDELGPFGSPLLHLGTNVGLGE